MKSIFDEATKNELVARIHVLNEISERKWGKMTVGQIAWHSQDPLKMAIENKNLQKKEIYGFRYSSKSQGIMIRFGGKIYLQRFN